MTSSDQQAEPFEGSVPPLDFAGIETTRCCNLRCRMCIQFNDGTTVPGPRMERSEFERIAGSLIPYVTRASMAVGVLSQ